ncbi:protein neuralized-like [Mercenaria mercenaria]|uniref:protein neuralized-like n=1 Tax=Mercenaria mercenaria TaxID=6596 RepID=UPI00234F95AB|nr:protein neuralized-like [Mercenaria mercenaria]
MHRISVALLVFLSCLRTHGLLLDEDKLEPMKFSESAHGPKITLSENDTVATRYEGYCWSVCLTDRPLRVGQTLHFNISEIETGWMANLNVGIIYTSPDSLPLGSLVTCDANLSVSIPNTEVFIFEKFYSSDNLYSFRVDNEGKAYLSPNVTSDNVVFIGVDVKKTFWAIFNIFGDSKAVKLLGLN